MACGAVHRQTPEAGARCVNSARRDLCGGYPVTGIPTATLLTVSGAFQAVSVSGQVIVCLGVEKIRVDPWLYRGYVGLTLTNLLFRVN